MKIGGVLPFQKGSDRLPAVTRLREPVDLQGAVRWLFEWVAADQARVWIYLVVCVLAIFVWALASLMDLGWEVGLSIPPGLLVAAHSGFFLGLAVFSMVLLALWIYLGRSARVKPSPLEAVSAK